VKVVKSMYLWSHRWSVAEKTAIPKSKRLPRSERGLLPELPEFKRDKRDRFDDSKG